jgi:beta-xylosidase
LMPFDAPPTDAVAGKEPAAMIAPASAPWLADRGNGTYRNPVLFADYSDPDAIRVGDDFWMTASSFNHAPGLPILHSRDLVNWSLVNYALPRLVPEKHFSIPRHGEGVWAPSIRYHGGKYWIFYPDPDFGLYVITANDPRGVWSPPHLIKAGKGLIDPCPFWDNDGTAYLIHGWAKSRAGISNRLTLHRLDADSTALADQGVVLIDADALPGWHTLEGPKLYRRGEYYYIFAPAGGVKEGYQAVFRSRNLYGPYEHRIVLEQGSTPINGPHQGAWVDTPAGENWFLHFQDANAYGRVVHLQPLAWTDDGWPKLGKPNARGGGEPVLTHAKPAQLASPPLGLATSDNFSGPKLGLQWQWEANPQPTWASLSARANTLRLECVPLRQRSLWHAGNLLLQKFPAPSFEVTVGLEFAAEAEGDRAGLVVFGYDYAWIGLRRDGDRLSVVYATCPNAHEGRDEHDLAVTSTTTTKIELRVTVSADARCEFAYRIGTTPFIAIAASFQARPAKWVGAKVGLFASAKEKPSAPGHADFTALRLSGAVP